MNIITYGCPLNCSKLEIAFRCQTRLLNSFRYKDPIPKYFISDFVYRFQCGLYNKSHNGESMRHLDIRSALYIGVSTLACEKAEPTNHSAVRDYLLPYNYLHSFDNLNILALEFAQC